jgi:amino acid adenylation domain-containing protein
MSALELLDELKDKDIKLWREGHSLKFDAPAGVMDKPLREKIKARKLELLHLLATPIEQSEAPVLSLAQQRIWFHEKILQDGVSYQIPGAVQIEGPFDAKLLEAAFNSVIARHDILRLAIIEEDGKPIAKYAEKIAFTIQVTELNSDGDQHQELKTDLEQFAMEPFRMAEAPLIKFRLFRLHELKHVFALSFHHIIADGWSVALFVDELSEAYRAIDNDKGWAPLLPAPCYRDYIREITGNLAGHKGSLDAFWKEYLKGAPLQFDFPSDRSRPPVENDAGNEIGQPLDRHLMKRVSALARKSGTTLYILLFAACCTLLYRLTGQSDLIIGTPHAGRQDPKLNSALGLFADTLPLRCKSQGDTTFRQFLSHCREQVFSAFDHAGTPFDWIVNTINPPRDLSRTPIYQVMFSFLNQPKAIPEFPHCKVTPLPLQNVSSKVDLSLAVEENAGKYRVSIEYKTDLFDEPRMRSLLQYYVNLLESIVTDPDALLLQLTFLPADEQTRFLRSWNDTDRETDRSLSLASILDRADLNQDITAYALKSTGLSYAELRSQSRKIAIELVQRGVHTDEIVAVMLERDLHYPVVAHGILQAGAAFLPLSPACPSERLEYIMGNSGANLLIVSRFSRVSSTVGKAHSIAVEDLLEAPVPKMQPTLPEVSQDQLAYCIYTSGTTGKPKGVEICHRAAINLLQALASNPGLPPGSSMLGVVPFSFDMSIPDIFLPIYTGGTCVILDETASKTPDQLNEIAAMYPNPVLQATASTLRMLLAQDWKIPGHLRIWCGGELFPPDLARQIFGKCAELFNIYGPTETTVWSSVHRITKVENPLSVGRPLQNTRTYILDDNLNPLPPGYPGQLYIAGEGLARGYRHNPELTADKFINHLIEGVGNERLYGTGDLTRWRRDGTLDIIGRIDAQLKILGHRIEPGEIETVLTNFPSIAEAAVTTSKDSSGELQLTAYVVCPEEIDLDSIRFELRKKIPSYMEPRWICRIDEIPRSANGKIDRKSLPEPSLTTKTPKSENRLASGVEEQMGQLWTKLLQRVDIGRNQNFFELGGHSLLAVHLLAEVKKMFGTLVPIITFLQDPTINGLCQAVTVQNDSGPKLIDLTKDSSAKPLIFIPGASGNPYSYTTLTTHLSPEFKLVGIAPAETVENIPLTIEAIAQDYISLLRGVIQAPYRLVGHSFGAAVAFEMARQLLMEGQPVESLIILDLPATPYLKSGSHVNDIELLSQIAEAAQEFSGKPLSDMRADFSELELEEAKKRLLQVLETSGMLPAQYDSSLADVVLSRYRTSLTALDNYKIRPISIPLTVIRPEESESTSGLPEALGWDKYTSEDVRSVCISGSHISMISEPHVLALADEINKILVTNL